MPLQYQSHGSVDRLFQTLAELTDVSLRFGAAAFLTRCQVRSKIEDASSHDVDLHAVKGRCDVCRRLGFGCGVVEIDMHIGEHGLARLEAFDEFERFRQAQMTWMRRWAKRVDDPDVEVLQGRMRGGGYRRQIAAISQAANAVAKGVDVAMDEIKGVEVQRATRAVHRHGVASGDFVGVEDGRIGAARRRRKAVAKGFAETRAAIRRKIDIDTAPVVQRQNAQIIDAVSVVGMLMTIEYAVQPIDMGFKQLFAQIGSGVDQHAGRVFDTIAPAFDEQ